MAVPINEMVANYKHPNSNIEQGTNLQYLCLNHQLSQQPKSQLSLQVPCAPDWECVLSGKHDDAI